MDNNQSGNSEIESTTEEYAYLIKAAIFLDFYYFAKVFEQNIDEKYVNYEIIPPYINRVLYYMR